MNEMKVSGGLQMRDHPGQPADSAVPNAFDLQSWLDAADVGHQLFAPSFGQLSST